MLGETQVPGWSAWWQGHEVGKGGLSGVDGVMVSLGNHYVCDACETASGDVWVTDGDV